MKVVTIWKGNGYVAFYKNLEVIKDLANLNTRSFLDEWVIEDNPTMVDEWHAFIRCIKMHANLIDIKPGDFFTCTEKSELLWAFVYATPEAVEAFKISEHTQAFTIYPDTNNLCVQCTLDGPEPLNNTHS